ncbi:hypothetical protein [Nocardioides sediminis]|uniref:hypothetical protein n=1 Tax=Nocardioides sediminis TaxID=433648 RepID=UPI000D31F5B2|nr:hypothetical protein [Nocardioides sediminis]
MTRATDVRRTPLVAALPAVWTFLFSVVLLGPALGWGYVLTYDMVWVPQLDLRADTLGLGSALPRAVPSDAVVAVLDEVVPAVLLQKVVLLGSLLAAGTGAAALVAERSTAARLVAATVAVWNPFVVERLLIGHWPLLVGYAVLPWLVVSLRRGRREDRLPLVLPLLLVLGSLSASAGLATAVATLACGADRDRPRRTLALLALVLAANAPWLVAGLVQSGGGTSDPVGATLFATGDEGLLPAPWAALSLGGIWNAELVPVSRTGWAGVATTVLVVVAAAVALVRVGRGRARVDGLGGLVVCWGVGFGLALVSWAAPDTLGRLAATVPGGGLVRDGSRLLGLTVPLVVVLVAVSVDALLARLPDLAGRVMVGGVLALVPVSLMPDALWGVGGRLAAVAYPASYDEARTAVASAPAGDAVSLPFVSYRAPEWNNGGRRVLDPLGRYLDRPVVVNDELVVSGTRIAGEDPRAARVSEALAAGSPGERAAELHAVGVSVVVVEEIEGYPVPAVSGTTTLDGDLTVVELGPAEPRSASAVRRGAVGAAWAGWLALAAAPFVAAVRRRRSGSSATSGMDRQK